MILLPRAGAGAASTWLTRVPSRALGAPQSNPPFPDLAALASCSGAIPTAKINHQQHDK